MQGTTPRHGFRVPFDASIIKVARFVYSQNGEIICTKTGADVVISTNEVATTLTQEDTYKFASKLPVKLILRVLTQKGDALVSNPVHLLCLECECKEVLA
jgi:hypothetical protein